MSKKIDLDYFRNFVFGAEDSFVSTVGVLFGLASSNEYTPKQIIVAGMILMTVEALSMGAGSFLSEKEVHEMDVEHKHRDNPIIGGIIMFVSYFMAGFVPLLPYVIMPVAVGKYVSVGFTLIALFLLGYVPSKMLSRGLRMMVIAGAAILAGDLVGTLFHNIHI